MNKNEKGISAKDASNTDQKNKSTIENLNTPRNKFQSDSTPSRRDLLETTKLSRLPQRTPFRLPDFDNAPTNAVVVVAVCAGCGGRLDADDNFLQLIHGCRKCIGIYARIDTMLDEVSKRKTKELLEKMISGGEK